MKMLERIVTLSVLLLLAALLGSPDALAWPNCQNILATTYPASQTAALGGCQTCHQVAGSGSSFNVYGAALRANGASGAGSSCTAVDFAAVLKKIEVEGADSDGNGDSNIVEIEGGAQPGWCDITQNSSCTNSAGSPPNVLLDPVAQLPTNTPPTANAGGPYNGESGTTLIQFDGSGSNDSDGDALTFAWAFGDGSSGSGMLPTHTYSTAGDFEVSLVVNDGLVDSDADRTTAVILSPVVNIAPTADPGGPYTGEPGQLVAFDGSASTDPNGDPLTYAWDFGDGAMSSGATPTHAFTAEGTYTISLTVDDGQIASTAVNTIATVATPPSNRRPTADAGGPYNGETGVNVSFDGTASSDPDGDVLSYSWDFGDGRTGTGAAPNHAYAAAGTYTVNLTVNDSEFDSAVANGTVTVTDPVNQSDGAALYSASCLGCHGDPWSGPAVDAGLPGLRRVAGARECSISGSIFGTSVFPNGVPEMQFLQGLSTTEIDAIADHLNSGAASGEQRYITACAGCHGNDGSGGRVHEGVRGDSASETWEAIGEEREMKYLACMPRSDIDAITVFLKGSSDSDSRDDDDESDHGGGSTGPLWFALLTMVALQVRSRRRNLPVT